MLQNHIDPADVVFTPSVQSVQVRRGSRASYARFGREHGWETRITPELADFIGRQNSVFIATANLDGQPYIQHRGGPPGFLHVLDEGSIAFADFAGNKQYITVGNLADNPKSQLFLIDYAQRQRIKIWGEAGVVEGDAELEARLAPPTGGGRVERAIVFAVKAWDANCPQHIPRRFEAADVAAALEERDRRIAALEQELAQLRDGARKRGEV